MSTSAQDSSNSRVRQQQRDGLFQIEEEIAQAGQQAAALEEHLEFVYSPAAVEAWARENGWARPEEMPVVLIGPEGEAAPPDERGLEDGSGNVSPREVWWELFFGDR